MTFKKMTDINVSGKTVFVRADLNVPAKNGKITDDTRIVRFAPTVIDLVKRGAKVLVASHFGRPDGEKKPEFSLSFLASALQKTIGLPVKFVDDCIGDKVKAAVSSMKNGDVVLLENVRFYPGEEKNDPAFAKQLAQHCDLYVNDAFSCAHRAHASTEGIAHLLPSSAGLLMAAELTALDKALGAPVHPVMAIVGGSKVSTKLDLLSNLINKVDYLVIGGAMANTFLLAQGKVLGRSLVEAEMTQTALSILDAAQKKGCKILLPADVVVAAQFAEGQITETVMTSNISDGKMALDVGPRTVEEVCRAIDSCKTLIWNGPFGAFEIVPFNAATNAVAAYVAKRTREKQLLSVAGGGDTVSALNKAGVDKDMTYVSAAGGAFLEWMEGKVLPGVKALG